MEYAEKIMRKYGWQEGKGLGRDEQGDPKPLKRNLKFDKAGMGYHEKVSQETKNPWWVRVYDEAASKKANSSNTSRSKSSDEDIRMNFDNLTDEELFAACGGRTAHKAARHGLKLNGKLERIRKQEMRQAAEENEEVSADASSAKKRKRKKADSSEKVEEVSEPSVCQSEDVGTSAVNNVSRKKSKKRAKRDEDHADDTCTQDISCQQPVSKKKSKKNKIKGDTEDG